MLPSQLTSIIVLHLNQAVLSFPFVITQIFEHLTVCQHSLNWYGFLRPAILAGTNYLETTADGSQRGKVGG